MESLHADVFMVIQRFRSDLGLFVHLHVLITDGAAQPGLSRSVQAIVGRALAAVA